MSTITTAVEAEAALEDMTAVVENLRCVIEEETTLVRAGRLRAAAVLEPRKRELAGRLFAGGERLKANAKFLLHSAPAPCGALHRAQESLRAVLQANKVVLATAHAVSEGIVRRLSADLAHKSNPQVYGASGRATAANARCAQPLALSRTL